MNIKKEEYQKYLDWKEQKEKEKSLFSVKTLEEDIDYPIRNSVAILALAGCSPMFSCCGFDYHGQPPHKTHQYGEPYIMMKSDPNTLRVLGTIYTRLPATWKLEQRNGLVFLELVHLNNPHWNDHKVVHFSENLVIAINSLESVLFKNLQNEFAPEVILEDTNENHNRNLKYWQYPPKAPWVITLDSLNV